jgi:dipeptidyl aminopeptidase/acylaminoacyl peptidase
VVAGSATTEPGVHRVDLTGAVTTLRAPRDLGLAPAGLSVAEHLTYPSGERRAHALLFPPASATHAGPEGEAPPLVVVIHGGPTSAAFPGLALGTQYWTSRGFAVVSVNHGGSTGYGREFRDELLGEWGVVDVADCLAAVRHLTARGLVDPARTVIRGGSAGGFTVLRALLAEDTPFAAGADHFGVADLEALARDTHKFESRYLDRLVGPYPAERERYVERSPVTHLDRLDRPLIVLQGSEDAVVPPSQSEAVVAALRARGRPVAYLLFDGEQHGFRRAENIRRALDAELSFYAQVLGFALPEAEGIEPVAIENL